jgi:hypothetical protein
MAFASPTKRITFWQVLLPVFEIVQEKLIAGHPDAKMEIDLIRDTLLQICQLVRSSPNNNANELKLEQLTDTAETEMKTLAKYVEGKALYTSLLKLYSSVYKEMRDLVQANSTETNQEAELQPAQPYLNHMLKSKRKLRKLWQETRDPKVKTELNRTSKAIRRMISKERKECSSD